MELSFCLICTSQYQPSQQKMGGDVTVKQERMEDDDHHHSHPDAEHLKPFFVLSAILNVPAQTLDQLNCGENSDRDPLSGLGAQVPLCPACAERARQFHEVFVQISRLQVTLDDIQSQFFEALQLYKDAKCQDSGSIWEEIRRQALLRSLTDVETGENDHFSEEWHFGDTVVKSDVADDENDEEDEAFVLPTSSLHAPDESGASTSQVLEQTASNLTNDDEEVDRNLPLRSVVTPPTKKRKSFASQTFPKMSGKQAKWLQYGNRPYRSRKVKLRNAHVSVREEGTQGLPCENNVRHFGEEKIGPGESQSTIGISANNPADNNIGIGDENEDDDEVEVDLQTQQRPKRQKTSQPGFATVLWKEIKGTIVYECSNCPYRCQVKKEMYAHVLLHKKDSQAIQCQDCGYYLAPDKLAGHRVYHHVPKTIRKGIKKTAQPSPVLLNCPHCPHKTTHTSAYQCHQQVHQKGSGSAACNECGIFVLPNRLVRHQIFCAHAIRNSLGKDEKLSRTGRRKFEMHNTSNSNFISFKRAPYKSRQYGCRHCSYETIQLWRMKVHVELHGEGSQAERCGECGWFLPPGQMETHRAVNHSVEEPQKNTPAACALLNETHSCQESNRPVKPGSSVKKSLESFRCANCPFECKRKDQLDLHLALHSEDSMAAPCPDCDIFCRPAFGTRHHNCGKWKIRKTLRQKKARLAYEGSLSQPNPERK